MPGYGIGTDHFGVATSDLVLIASDNTPKPQTRETAQNEDGDFVDEGQYDGAAAEAVECTYRLISGTLNLNTLALGYILNGATHLCIETIEVSTSNSEWPTVRLSGYKDVTDYTNFSAFTLPSITISGKKQAQGLNFTVGANCRLISSSLTASGELAHALNDSGDVGAMAFSGAEIVISGEAVEISGAVSWTPNSLYIETQAPGAGTTNTSWATGSFEAARGITPDT